MKLPWHCQATVLLAALLALLAAPSGSAAGVARARVGDEPPVKPAPPVPPPRDRGLNLPTTQGTTRDGAFFPGVYEYEYDPAHVSHVLHGSGFSSLRLAVNVETALNASALQRHKAYIDAIGGRGILCLFDNSAPKGTTWPRTGRLTGKIQEAAQAWRAVHGVFASYGDAVMYEIFNEPWGYQGDAAAYVSDMRSVVQLAGLPEDRIILAGLFGAADVQSVARAGWQGFLAYHAYSFWLPEGQRTRENFNRKIQQDLAGLSSRVYITEFGVGLDNLRVEVDEDDVEHDVVRHVDKQTGVGDWLNERPTSGPDLHEICKLYPDNLWCAKELRSPSFAQKPNFGADVSAHFDTGAVRAVAPSVRESETMAFLGGLRDALSALKAQKKSIRGLYHWHGWHNGDSWDFWDAANAKSSRMIQMIMSDLAQTDAVVDDGDPFLSQDFVSDDQQVHMVRVQHLSLKPDAACPSECAAARCQPGNPAQIGGKLLSGDFCIHTCSQAYAMPNGALRYCGAGAAYEHPGAVHCGGCANPATCGGLPCWYASAEEASGNRTRLAGVVKPVGALRGLRTR